MTHITARRWYIWRGCKGTVFSVPLPFPLYHTPLSVLVACSLPRWAPNSNHWHYYLMRRAWWRIYWPTTHTSWYRKTCCWMLFISREELPARYSRQLIFLLWRLETRWIKQAITRIGCISGRRFTTFLSREIILSEYSKNFILRLLP